MGSDRARVSHDPSRQWRGVISQQGRVTLEADWNEAAEIAADASRAQLVDVIGPTGTVDGGYQVTVAVGDDGAATGDLTIGHGTMYVGGERVALDQDLVYGQQPEWLDRQADQLLWRAPAVPSGDAVEAVSLLLREQEVGAVEDPALLDVALGGPDTSERRRILQRVVRQTTIEPDATPDEALAELASGWRSQGLAYDAATARLESLASLQVSFPQTPSRPSPSDPPSQSGYLGAENQLIRVQVVDVADGGAIIAWGYDNAHDLYRLEPNPTVNDSDGSTTVTLANAPVDAYHQPVAGQAVEILQARCALTGSDYIAADTGIVTTCTSDYQPDSRQLTIGRGLDTATADSPLLFMRVWQETVTATGDPVRLGDTGITVTINTSGGPSYNIGDYWTFAVRPSAGGMPAPVYPARIVESPQPPDGPKQWACPLAVVSWQNGTATVTDCRRPFEGLDALAARTAADVPFSPGTYEVLTGSTSVAQALDLLAEHAAQGNDFPLALLRLFGRGVIAGMIPSIAASAPASGATDVPVDISITDGTVLDGRGAVLSFSGVRLETTVPSYGSDGDPVDVKQWLYLLNDAGQNPRLELRPAGPADALTLSQDVVTAVDSPSTVFTIPPDADCATAEAAAWQPYADVPTVYTNADAAVCLGVIGVRGGAAWTAPDDREQVFPTPAVIVARRRMQQPAVYGAIENACLARGVTMSSITLDSTALDLNGSNLLAGTSARSATIALSDPVRGTNPLVIFFQSSGGITVHGPLTIPPGSSTGSFTFDIAANANSESITAIIDSGLQLQVSFTAVPVQIQVPSQLFGSAYAAATVSLASPVDDAFEVTFNSAALSVDSRFDFTPNDGAMSNRVYMQLVDPSGDTAGLDVSVSLVGAQGQTFHYDIGVVRFQLVLTNPGPGLPSPQPLDGTTVNGTTGDPPNTISGVAVQLSAPLGSDPGIQIDVDPSALIAPSDVNIPAGTTLSDAFDIQTEANQFGQQWVCVSVQDVYGTVVDVAAAMVNIISP